MSLLTMREKIINSVISAIVGGITAFIVMWWCTPKTVHINSLEVGTLNVTEQLSMRSNSVGNDEILMKSGSIILQNKVVASQFLGTQVSASVLVGNRIYTSPDNLFATPMNDWKFFTELGSDPLNGGELLVRSPKGGNSVHAKIEDGIFIRMGFDSTDKVTFYAQHNASTIPLEIVRRQPPGPNETAPLRPFARFSEMRNEQSPQLQMPVNGGDVNGNGNVIRRNNVNNVNSPQPVPKPITPTADTVTTLPPDIPQLLPPSPITENPSQPVLSPFEVPQTANTDNEPGR
ncbi:MAG: hypothetical protein LBU65_13365 [Planctomycetaceae bacterium]|nr:hypothetical protein [Planctomycetaceae bacterium]